MTPEQAKQNLELIKAFAEGKAVQCQQPDGTWHTLVDSEFRASKDKYRIKPEPKYRPFTAEESKGLVSSTLIGKYSGHLYLVTFWSKANGGVKINNEHTSLSTLLEAYTLYDGSPCGVLINE